MHPTVCLYIHLLLGLSCCLLVLLVLISVLFIGPLYLAGARAQADTGSDQSIRRFCVLMYMIEGIV